MIYKISQNTLWFCSSNVIFHKLHGFYKYLNDTKKILLKDLLDFGTHTSKSCPPVPSEITREWQSDENLKN